MPLNPDAVAAINEIATALYERELTRAPEAQALFRARGLSDAAIVHWRLGYAPRGGGALLAELSKSGWGEAAAIEAGVAFSGDRGTVDFFRDRLMFPIPDRDGVRIAGFSSRHMDPKIKKFKYLNTTETTLYKKGEILYGLTNLEDARSAGFIYLVEGNFDMLGLWHAGVRNVAALCGTALTTEHLALLAPVVGRIDLVLDADDAGEKATLRSLVELEGVDAFDLGVVELAGGKDPDEIVREDPSAWARLTSGRISRWEYLWHITGLPYEREAAASVEARVAWKNAWCELVRDQYKDNPSAGRHLLVRLEKRLRLPSGLLAAEYLGLTEPSPAPAKPGLPNLPALARDDLLLTALAARWPERKALARHLELGVMNAAIAARWAAAGRAELPARLANLSAEQAAEAEELWNAAVRRAGVSVSARIRELSNAVAAGSADPGAIAEMKALRAAMAARGQ